MAVYREIDGNIVREYKLDIHGIIYRKQSDKALLEIVPTLEYGNAFFIDGELQLTEKDEYIYHEMFVHPCLGLSSSRRNICILGGGDGCAAREVLRWSGVWSIDLIDWDKDVTDLFTRKYGHLNNHVLQDPRIHIENCNIQELLHEQRGYNCVLIDLLDPDPTKEGQIDLWYDVLFLAKNWVVPGGCIVINAGGCTPWQTQSLKWILDLVRKRFAMSISLYKVFVPSFGREWCFILLTQNETNTNIIQGLPEGLRYLTPEKAKSFHLNRETESY